MIKRFVRLEEDLLNGFRIIEGGPRETDGIEKTVAFVSFKHRRQFIFVQK